MRLLCLLLVVPAALCTNANSFQKSWANDTGGSDGDCTNSNITNPNDVNLLNYYLSIANLQNAFYQQNLGNLDDGAFNNSGLSSQVRNNYVQIQQNKQEQVNLLAQTLGCQATPFCTYDFHVNNNVSNFTATSQAIENIGTSAYVGSIPELSNSTLQTWAASILSANGRAAGYAATTHDQQPMPLPFDTPLDPEQVTTLMSPYIVSCPQNSTNVFTPGNNLFVTQNGTDADLSFNNTSGDTPLFAVFHQGLQQTFVPINNGAAPIPANVSGPLFVDVVNDTSVDNDGTRVAGPGILNIPVANGANATGVPPVAPTTTFASSVPATSESATSESATSSASATSEQSTVVVTSTSAPTTSEQSTVVVTATSQESTVVVTATSSA